MSTPSPTPTPTPATEEEVRRRTSQAEYSKKLFQPRELESRNRKDLLWEEEIQALQKELAEIQDDIKSLDSLRSWRSSEEEVRRRTFTSEFTAEFRKKLLLQHPDFDSLNFTDRILVERRALEKLIAKLKEELKDLESTPSLKIHLAELAIFCEEESGPMGLFDKSVEKF